MLAANGLCVSLARADAPTPVVSFAIPTLGAVGGVMITASHNPPRYNGIKLKSAYGGSATVADTKRVEAKLGGGAGRGPRAEAHGPRRRPSLPGWSIASIRSRHTRRISRLIDFETIRKAHLRVSVDAMYGTGRGYLKRLLGSGGLRSARKFAGEMNPGFNGIHPEPIAQHLAPLMELTPARGRSILGSPPTATPTASARSIRTARFVDPHRIMTLALKYLVETRGLRGAVVKTVSTTQMLNRLAAKYGLPLHETPVGFNYIGDLMMQGDVLIGGEESGGISIKGHIPEGDGVLMGLLHGRSRGVLRQVARGDAWTRSWPRSAASSMPETTSR